MYKLTAQWNVGWGSIRETQSKKWNLFVLFDIRNKLISFITEEKFLIWRLRKRWILGWYSCERSAFVLLTVGQGDFSLKEDIIF